MHRFPTDLMKSSLRTYRPGFTTRCPPASRVPRSRCHCWRIDSYAGRKKGGRAAAFANRTIFFNLSANLTIFQTLHVIPVSLFVITIFLDPGSSPVLINTITDAALLVLGNLSFFHGTPHNSIWMRTIWTDKFTLSIIFSIATNWGGRSFNAKLMQRITLKKLPDPSIIRAPALFL